MFLYQSKHFFYGKCTKKYTVHFMLSGRCLIIYVAYKDRKYGCMGRKRPQECEGGEKLANTNEKRTNTNPKKAQKKRPKRSLSGIIVFLKPAIRVFVSVSIIALQLFLLSYLGLFTSTLIEVSPEQPKASSPMHSFWQLLYQVRTLLRDQ